MRKWNYKKPPATSVEQLSQQLEISNLLAQLLVNRGITEPPQADHFLNATIKDLPNPFLLKDLKKAVERIVIAIDNKEKIVIYGDYDVDGTSSTSLLIHFFREIGYPVSFYIPHRLNEGYSMNIPSLHRLKEEGTKLIITVDNGIMAHAPALECKKLGIDLIVTDHHEIPEVLPEAFALINPLQKDCSYPSKEICGTGVAFNLIMGLRQHLREKGFFQNRPEPNLRAHLDLVALATVADVVPLTGANRIFVKAGLKEISQTQKAGLKALKEVSQIKDTVTVSHLGFRLGPRINAGGRLYDAAIGVKLITSENKEDAIKLARQLDSANRERQNIEEQILQEALLKMESDPAHKDRMSHVLYDESWHLGVVGIVASRIVSRYLRPPIILANDAKGLKGSARSFGGLNIIEAIRACEEHLMHCGGHKAAAGLALKKENLEKFVSAFEKEVAVRISKDDCVSSLEIDSALKIESITDQFLAEVEQLGPYGQGNPEPVFSLNQIIPVSTRRVGNNHLKIAFAQKNIDAIGFDMADRAPKENAPIDLAFTCERSSYSGGISLKIKEIR